MNIIKFTPQTWCSILGIEIIDPDGWDRRNFTYDFSIPLRFDDFMDKADESTCRGYPNDRNVLRGMAIARICPNVPMAQKEIAALIG